MRQGLRLHYSKSFGFATNPKRFGTGFVLVLTNKYESGLKKVPRLSQYTRNPKRKLCIQNFSFVQTFSCFTKPYSPLSPAILPVCVYTRLHLQWSLSQVASLSIGIGINDLVQTFVIMALIQKNHQSGYLKFEKFGNVYKYGNFSLTVNPSGVTIVV